VKACRASPGCSPGCCSWERWCSAFVSSDIERPADRCLRLVSATACTVVAGVMVVQGMAQLTIARYQEFGGPPWVNNDIARIERGAALAELVQALVLGRVFIVLRRSICDGGRVKGGRWTVLGVAFGPLALYPLVSIIAPTTVSVL
jgi:hypothetical protein